MLFDTVHWCILASVLSTVWHEVQLQGISCPPPGNTPEFGNGQWKTSSINGKCYGGPRYMMSFGDADRWCKQHHSSLAMPKTNEDVTALANAALSILDSGGLARRTPPNIWIGLDDIEDEGIWKWADGRKLTDSQSRFGDLLDNAWGEQHCATMYVPGDSNEWDDDICWKFVPFLCETDKYYQPSRCPPGWTYFDCGGYCYIMSPTKMARKEDYQIRMNDGNYKRQDESFPNFCTMQNGIIAMTKTRRQYRAVMLMINRADDFFSSEAWIGLRRARFPDHNEWDDGESMKRGLARWGRESSDGEDRCISMDMKGRINARLCSHTKYVVCQKPQISSNISPNETCGLTWNQERQKRYAPSNTDQENVRSLPNIVSNDTQQQEWLKTNMQTREKNEYPKHLSLNLGDITNGKNMAIEDAPWSVRLLKDKKFSCGGVIIGARYVLTDSHCLGSNSRQHNKDRITISVGSESRDSHSGRTEPVHVIKRHEDHKTFDGTCAPDGCQYDIAIVELKRSLPLDCWNIRAVKLPRYTQSGFRDFSKCTMIGWGTGSGDSLKVCEGTREDVRNSGSYHLLAKFLPCFALHGDSGSPLMCLKNEPTRPQWMVLGLIQGDAGSYIKTSNVKTFLKWIQKNTQDNGVYTERVCEGDVETFSCDYGRPPTIKIIEALWGRVSKWFCRTDNENDLTDCKQRDVTQTLKAKCEGKQRCEVDARRAVYGNPCRATYLYLQLRYQCVYVDHSRQVVCTNGGSLDISCGAENGLTISILAASYGRYSDSTCPTSPARSYCHNDWTATVKKRCEGKAICITQLQGEACSTHNPYFDVVYRCNPARTFSVVMCRDNDWLGISCEEFEGTTIDIVSGFYGRTTDSICPTQAKRVLSCTSDVKQKIADKCSGKRQCRPRLSYTYLGDPCPEFNKYLEVVYRCSAETCRVDFEKHGTFCYKYVSKVKTHSDAQTDCAEMKAYLAEPRSEPDNDVIKNIIRRQGLKRSIWLGATDIDTEGEFVWQHKGVRVVWTDWMIGQPNNWTNQDCLEYHATSERWNDEKCKKRQHYICQSGPECSNGFTRDGNICYKLFKKKKEFKHAVGVCRKLEAILAEPLTVSTNDDIQAIVANSAVHDIWLGATDIAKEGTWTWRSNGKVLSYTDWASDEPNNLFRDDADCLATTATAWFDSRCNWPRSYICMKSAENPLPEHKATGHSGQDTLLDHDSWMFVAVTFLHLVY